jgi:hypothetical protein
MIRRLALSDRISDALDGAALGLLVRLESDGFTIRAVGDRLLVRPIARLRPEDRSAIDQHRQELLALLLICDTHVQDRVAAFRAQLANGSGPLFVFRSAPGYSLGLCYSCREPFQRTGGCRCLPCALAVQLACRAPIDPASTGISSRPEAA